MNINLDAPNTKNINNNMFSNSIPEEQLKVNVRDKFFPNSKFDYKIIGKIDFCISLKLKNNYFENEEDSIYSLYWAEAKKGTTQDIIASVTQLILTFGKAKTHLKYNAPKYVGAFDAEKICFVQYGSLLNVFNQNDFNWNVTPSDHNTKEFSQLYNIVKQELESKQQLFYYKEDENELEEFIKTNFNLSQNYNEKIPITKNNFVQIYNKWLKKVKPTIAVNWNAMKNNNILDSDFYLADLISNDNETTRDLSILLNKKRYESKKSIKDGVMNIELIEFNNNEAHKQFWNIYERPPKDEFIDYILERRDLLVPQDIREVQGSYFTPQKWVELSQQYLAKELGENWQDEYYIWDCCAGTGNMEVGLINKYSIWASTLDKADVDIMKDNAKNNKNNLLESHIFQFDFLNDDFSKCPQSLQEVLNNEEKRKKLVIYINPPYAEAASNKGDKKNKKIEKTEIYRKYKNSLGKGGGRELYTQFLMRIYKEIPACIIGNFSTLKNLQNQYFREFRQYFKPKLKSLFLVPSETFDNVQKGFSIGFYIWDLKEKEFFKGCIANVYDKNGNRLNNKQIISYDDEKYIIEWLQGYYDKNKDNKIAFLRMAGIDMQSNNNIYITSKLSENDIKKCLFTYISKNNIFPMCIYLSVRHCINGTWLNNKEQFLFPNDNWKVDKDFQSNCLVYALFHNQNKISNNDGDNYFIPFTEQEVEARDTFKHHFITDYIKENKIIFTEEAKEVLDIGREIYKYYHSKEDSNPNASFYDIKEYFKGRNEQGRINQKSNDVKYNKLADNLREKMQILAKKIQDKVYEYEFLKI